MARALADARRRTIQQLAQAKWQSSGLTDQHARKLGFKALSATQVKGLCSRFHEAGALLIPYWGLDDKKTKFFRVRYLERLPGAAGVIEKPQRYDQLPVLQEAYLPPLVDWRKISQDETKPVSITEGELKAACATASNYPTIALGGVYSFMSQKRGIDLLPILKQFVWKDRLIIVVYDNDLATNPDVQRAQRLLAERLTAEGALVRFGALPAGPAKGIDDYIVANGADAYGEVLAKSLPYGEGSAMHALNEEVALIRNDGVPLVVEKKSGIVMNPDIFARQLYANRHYMRQEEKGSGKNARTILVKDKLAPAWMEWEHRSELSKLTYAPGEPRVISGDWNTWTGWGLQPKRGPIEQWTWLLDFLFANDKKARRYFEQWLAYPLQHPGAKLYTSCVLWSRVKRLGKSMIGIVLKYIYGDHAVFINSRQLKSSFNTWAKDRSMVIGEEITAGEARVDSDYMKDLITNPFFTINSKFKAEYQQPNRTNFLHFSNHPDAFWLEDGDKRYLVHGITQREPAPREKYEWVNEWLHKDGRRDLGIPGVGPAAVFQHLLSLNLSNFNPNEHAPETTSKYEMTIAGKTDTGLWVMRLQEDPAGALAPLGKKLATECDLFTSEELYRAFDPQGRGAAGRSSLSSLGRHLASAGLRQVNGGVPVQTGDGKIHRLIAIRNVVKWEQSTRKQIKEHRDAMFAPQHAGEVK